MTSDTLTPADISAAEDALLRNPDTLQDWIADACMNKDELPWLPSLREIDPDAGPAPAREHLRPQ